jgi:CheY-like chemotaxis protein
MKMLVSDPVRVLCVDDDAGIVGLSVAHLEREPGMSATGVTSAAEALSRLEAGGVDCIVSDYEMPKRDGLDLLREVRALDGAFPFILFTGRGSEEIASEAISAGVTDYLQKGVGNDQYDILANRVRNAVEQYRATQELERTQRKLEELNRSAASLQRATDPAEIYDVTLDAADGVLEFEISGIYIREGEHFHPKGDSYFPPDADPIPLDAGVMGETYRTGKSVLIDDVQASETAEPDRPELRSAISIPIGEFGVFQAIAREPAFYTERDLELAELLLAQTTAALGRLC